MSYDISSSLRQRFLMRSLSQHFALTTNMTKEVTVRVLIIYLLNYK